MGKFNLKLMSNNVYKKFDEHKPAILMGIGIVGMFTTIGLAIKATPKACKLIDEKKQELGVEKLSVVDTVKTTYKCYIPAAGVCTVSTLCLLGSKNESARRATALATAYKLSESAFNEYKNKVVETIGVDKEKEVKDAIAKDTVEKQVNNNTIIVTGNGDTKCIDALFGRPFYSDIDKIKKAVNEANSRILNDNYISLNEFYDLLGMTNVEMGYLLGWNTDALIDVDYNAQLDENDVPCLVITHNHPPKYKYSTFGY